MQKKGILELFDMKHVLFPESFDENVSMIADVINNFLPWSARVVEQPTLDMMKAELDAGRPIIVPAYASSLQNVYFRGFFPYHMLVLSGYDDTEQTFIAEDPGTQYGHAYRYSYDTIMSAMHDFLPGNVAGGSKRVLFTSPDLGNTSDTDGDRDGLTKAQEFTYGTVSYVFDSDGDGFGDDIELQFGYLATKNEQAVIQQGALLIAPGSPQVYYMDAGTKHHVTSEAVFFRNGWNWQMLEWISDRMIGNIPTGSPLT